MTNSRFEVGKSYPFIGYTYTSEDGRNLSSHSYRYWEGMTVTTHLEMLACESEHDVPVDYSQDTAKGYILVDSKQRKAHNQYPSASYGQISNTADFIARIFDKEKGELLELIRIDIAYSDIARLEAKNPESMTQGLRDMKQTMVNFLKEQGLQLVESELMKKYKGHVFSYDIEPIKT